MRECFILALLLLSVRRGEVLVTQVVGKNMCATFAFRVRLMRQKFSVLLGILLGVWCQVPATGEHSKSYI